MGIRRRPSSLLRPTAEKTSLPEETIQFFEFEAPDRLSDGDKEYLRQLRNPNPTKSRATTIEISSKRIAKNLAKTDHCARSGSASFSAVRSNAPTCLMASCVHWNGSMAKLARLARCGRSKSGRRERTKAQWLELNADVATAFAVRYRGLPALMGGAVKWDTSHLFDYEALLEAASDVRSTSVMFLFRGPVFRSNSTSP